MKSEDLAVAISPIETPRDVTFLPTIRSSVSTATWRKASTGSAHTNHMAKKKASSKETPSLSQKDIVRAVTNDPSLSSDEFKLGDRTFKVVDLGYDDYLKFMVAMKPLLSGIAAGMSKAKGVSVPGIDLPETSATEMKILEFCQDELPEMVRIVCAQTDPDITVAEIKKLGKTPFNLAPIALKQMVRNNIISQFTSFFGQILPLMGMVGLKTPVTA